MLSDKVSSRFVRVRRLAAIALLTLSGASAQVNITMNRYDLGRTAANTKETILNTSNVSPTTFGKLWSYSVDGVIFAQPLYVQGLNIGSKGNVLFVATMNDVVYAFDADRNAPPLWTRDFRVNGATPAPSQWVSELGSSIGILSTPVIDSPSNTGSMYLVAQTVESGNWVYRLHKLNLLTGADVVPSTLISATKSGITFDPRMQNQRPGLVVVNGEVVVCFSARPLDDRPYHGWAMTFDATTLAQKTVFITTTTDDGAGIWGSGGAPPVDSSGNVYMLTGNAFDPNVGYNGSTNFSESLLKMSTTGGTFSLSDWFTAFNWSQMDTLDEDLSCNSPMLIPGTDLIAFGSKTADVYVAHTQSSLGHLQNNNSQLAAFFHVGAPTTVQFSDGDRILGLAYWTGPKGPTMFAWPAFDSIHGYTINGSSFSETSSNPIKGFGEPGMPISVSANGSTSGTGIVWTTMMSSSGRSVGQPGEVHAFNAEDLSQELWSSIMNKSRDDVGSPSKFVIPVVANGRLYMATSINTVQVYGMLPPSTGSITGAENGSTASANLTAEGSGDWIHWGDSALNRKAGVSAQLSTITEVGSGPITSYSNDLRPLSWTDGTPTPSAFGNTNGLFISGAGNGFSFTAPADTTARTLIVHAGGWNSGGTLTAHLSDGSTADFTNVTTPVGGQYDANYTLTYHAGSAGQTLTVTWIMTGGTGNVTLCGAAVTGTSSTGGGSLSAIGTSSSASTSLTSEGGTDWVHWGDSSLNRKSGVSPALSTFTVVGTGQVFTYTNDLRPLNWTDGTPTGSSSGNTNGIYISSVANGFSFTAPADTTSRTLTVHVGGWNSGGAFTAHLSDFSANDFSETTTIVNGQYDRNYTITYKAGSSGQMLTVTWVMASGTGNVTLNGAALSGTSSGNQGLLTGTASSSQALANLTGEGGTDWIHWGDSSLNRKAGVTAQLSTFTAVGSGAVNTYSNDVRPLSWSDGTPTGSSPSNKNGLFISSVGNGFSFTAPADTTTRTLTVHVGGWNSGGTLTAHLSDSSAGDFVAIQSVLGGQYDWNYVLVYHALSAGQTLTVTWKMSGGSGNVTLNGAALK